MTCSAMHDVVTSQFKSPGLISDMITKLTKVQPQSTQSIHVSEMVNACKPAVSPAPKLQCMAWLAVFCFHRQVLHQHTIVHTQT